MIKQFVIVSLAALLVSCGQHIKLEDNELGIIYSDIINADSLKQKCYLIDSIRNFEKKTLIENDTTYFMVQSKNTQHGNWKVNLHDSLILISNDKLDSISSIDPMTMTPVHYSFSLPYFSKDKRTFLIYYNFYCGSLCAEYSLRLYKKINGKWTFIKSYYTIVS